jgi:hypothetical protein
MDTGPGFARQGIIMDAAQIKALLRDKENGSGNNYFILGTFIL